jgi:hypothetical protein
MLDDEFFIKISIHNQEEFLLAGKQGILFWNN